MRPDSDDAMQFEEDGNNDGPEAELVRVRKRSRVSRAFRRDKSFAWGCVSFKFRSSPDGFQCDCPRLSHRKLQPDGSSRVCQFTQNFKPDEEDIVIRRMKYWIVQGFSNGSRHAHEKERSSIKKMLVSDLPSMEELDAMVPDIHRPVTDDESAVVRKPKCSRGRSKKISPDDECVVVRKTKRGRGRGSGAASSNRGRAAVAVATPVPVDKSSDSSSSTKSESSSSGSAALAVATPVPVAKSDSSSSTESDSSMFHADEAAIAVAVVEKPSSTSSDSSS